MMLDKTKIAELHRELDKTLKEFAEKHGLVAGASQIRYSATDFKATLMFSEREANPNAIDPRFLRDLRRNGFVVGLDESMLHRKVQTSRGLMEFIGMRASKAVLRDKDGKPYLYDAAMMASMLKGAK
jgi:hypothetical protein